MDPTEGRSYYLSQLTITPNVFSMHPKTITIHDVNKVYGYQENKNKH